MARVGHFEIHADDPEKLVAFYEQAFEWKITKWSGPMDYWMIVTGPDSERGINGGLMRRQGAAPVDGQAVNAYVCTMIVDSVDAALAKVTAAGGVVVVPKTPIPGVGWIAYAKDLSGNIFGLHKSDPAAG